MQANNMVSKDNLSIQLIKDVFDAAFIENILQDEILMVKGNYTIVLTIDVGQRYIDFMAIFNDEQRQDSERLEKMNLINKEIIGIKAYADDSSSITFQYHLWIEGGITTKNIVFSLRGFQMMVDAALEKINS